MCFGGLFTIEEIWTGFSFPPTQFGNDGPKKILTSSTIYLKERDRDR